MDFVRTVYGESKYQENLRFIAEALKPDSGQMPQEVIRNYLYNGFYADHVQTYQKRPIYWLFDSGKAGGFRALVYLHRYDANTLSVMRHDFLHELQNRYQAEYERLDKISEIASSTSEKMRIKKKKDELGKKQSECRIYDEDLNHAANERISLDLDDGVKVNYNKLLEHKLLKDIGLKK